MARPRFLTLVVLGLAVASTLGAAHAERLHVTAEVVQQTFTGDPANLQIGDRLITSVELFDDTHTKVGTGAGECTLVSLPPLDTLTQCLITAVFDKKGQIMFGGVAPLPEVGVEARFGIVGGTDDFRTVRGEVTLVVTTPEFMQDATFDLALN